MTDHPPTTDDTAIRGAQAGHGPGTSLEAIAVRISHDITKARERGDLPAGTRTVVTVLPRQRTLQIRVEGFDTVPEQAASRAVMTTLFDLAGDHNIIPLNPFNPPLFTQHIVLVDLFLRPFAAMVGAGAGETGAFAG